MNYQDYLPEIVIQHPYVTLLILLIIAYLICKYLMKKHKKNIKNNKPYDAKLPESEIPKAKQDLEFQILNNFLTPDECDQLVEAAQSRFKRSLVMDKHKKQQRSEDKGRTSHSAVFGKNEFPLLTKIDQKTSQILNIPTNHIEALQMVKYTAGQQYKPHHDWFKRPHDDANNQRVYTILVYLNDDYEGGETNFPKVDYSFKGKKGDAILWRNCQDNSPEKCFDHSLHAGTPPSRGTKYALNVWIRFKPYYPQ